MEVKIYIITDCNRLNYVGSTKNTLSERLSSHKSHKKNGTCRQCSSNLLDLNDCEIEILEECRIEDRNEREVYWIKIVDCVNIRGDIGVSGKDYKRWRRSWGDERNTNSLWRIDDTVFA
tara:strand:- start:216 stop:572 length:357 start_codon:yes stop_codon:yes gene_type:complete